MATLKMPQLGESVTEGTIAKWLKQPGDKINKYDPLAEVITDKVNAEVPSEFIGTLTEILVPEGATVAVGTPIAIIAEEGEAPAPAATPTAAAPVAAAAPAPAATVANAPAAGADRPRYSPAVMRLLQENNVDPTQIPGTGTGGRITRKDVLTFIEQGGAAAPAAAALTKTAEDMASLSSPVKPATGFTDLGAHGVQAVASVPAPAPTPAAPPAPAYQAAEGDQVIEASGIRKTIARRMVESKHNAPHAWTMMEVDMTSLVRFRDKNKEAFKKKESVNLTFLPFMIKAVVDAIKQYPIINSTWQDDKIIIKKDINISIAVATDDALFVPVIKNADRLSILGLSHAINDLAKRARAGKLSPNDMSGGTFTVNNTGAFGSVQSMPIINAPQAAILSMESIIKRPHVMPDDSFAIRSMMNMCMSLDHRVLDGWVCGQFLQAVKKNLESATEPTLY
ncbi:dihydrolipoamide acetyltransferase family protein [Tumebacillus permanentifrigoris]|uniref:Dihydrolipoamide acetyltransferase component of pyruvate dehydrogenase complex n=1 Tax=Tumebacillus permanentifrigoris TaxID=378543 RepID=A0A316D319_9BACL|nr:dihydrolipoamide acetyltransferase family protein [Tumebacillus permanentifrigoris]PWK05202.1 branched-chain alpha-keto acid dehydrogenase E2 component [Tumebacillus permanentifrigoris]